MSIQLIETGSYKTGMNEVQGLSQMMKRLITPILKEIQEKVYWRDVELEESEYKSRDGFIPYSSNCGGYDFSVLVPSVEKYEWGFLEFGECEDCCSGDDEQCGYEGKECGAESEGHLDAKFRVWFKFEGLEGDSLKFYLYAGGGNGDAPYFRSKYETTIFEASFECKSVFELPEVSKRHFKKLLKVIEG